MKKKVPAASLPPAFGIVWVRQHRQVGRQRGGQCASRLYLSYRLPSRVATSLPHPQHGTPANRAARYNNVAGTRVIPSPASADVSGTYVDSPKYNNQCNYSVEGSIAAHSSAPATIGAWPDANDIFFTAQAAKPCPDSEQHSGSNASAFCFGSPLATAAMSSYSPSARISGCRATVSRGPVARAACEGFWIFPS